MLLVCFTLLGLTTNQAFADSNDFKIYCNATLEDSFADDRIIVVVKSDNPNKIMRRKILMLFRYEM